MSNIFQKYDDARAQRRLRALAPYIFDGTEVHRVVNLELRGLENEIAASNIRHAIQSQYRNTIPVDVVIEIVGLLQQGEHE
jgi:hypothetical protein